MRRLLLLLALVASPALATVPTTTGIAGPYTCTGTVTAFAVPFKFFSSGDLVVTRTIASVDLVLTLASDYTVTGAGTASGTVTLVSAATCPAGATLKIQRVVALTQPNAFSTTGPFNPKSYENALDRTMMAVQQINDDRTNAATADYATTAGSATTANYASTAGYATSAGAATTATSAASADTLSTTLSASLVPLPAATTIGGIRSINCGTGSHVEDIGTDGIPVCTADAAGSGGGITTVLPSNFLTPGTVTGSFPTKAAGDDWVWVTSVPNATYATSAGSATSATSATTATALASDPADCAGSNWVKGMAANGTATCTQPDFTNLSGAASAAQLPTPTTTTNGGVKAITCSAGYFLSGITTAGNPTCTAAASGYGTLSTSTALPSATWTNVLDTGFTTSPTIPSGSYATFDCTATVVSQAVGTASSAVNLRILSSSTPKMLAWRGEYINNTTRTEIPFASSATTTLTQNDVLLDFTGSVKSGGIHVAGSMMASASSATLTFQAYRDSSTAVNVTHARCDWKVTP